MLDQSLSEHGSGGRSPCLSATIVRRKKKPPENLVIPKQRTSVNMQRNHDYITRKEKKKKRIEQKEVNILEEKRNGDDGKSG